MEIAVRIGADRAARADLSTRLLAATEDLVHNSQAVNELESFMESVIGK